MECVPRSIAERVELQCNGCCSCVITGVCVSGHELISNADVTPFIAPVLMRGVVVIMLQLLVELPPGAYAPGGPNEA